jgi:hypothetical protein
MSSEYCPRCRAPRNVRVDVTRLREALGDGHRQVETRSYHCETCRQFLRSERVELPRSRAA